MTEDGLKQFEDAGQEIPKSPRNYITIWLIIYLVSFYSVPVLALFLPFWLVYKYVNPSDVFYYLAYASLALELLLVLIFTRSYTMLPARLAMMQREKRVPELIQRALKDDISSNWIIFAGYWLKRYAIVYLSEYYCKESVGALLLLGKEGPKRIKKLTYFSITQVLEKQGLQTIEDLENQLRKDAIPSYETTQVNKFMSLAQD